MNDTRGGAAPRRAKRRWDYAGLFVLGFVLVVLLPAGVECWLAGHAAVASGPPSGTTAPGDANDTAADVHGTSRGGPAWLYQGISIFVAAILLTFLGIYRFRGIDEQLHKIRDSVDGQIANSRTLFEDRVGKIEISVANSQESVNKLVATTAARIEEIVKEAQAALARRAADHLRALDELAERKGEELKDELVGVVAGVNEATERYREAAQEFESRTGWLREAGKVTSRPANVGEAHRLATAASTDGDRESATAILREILNSNLDGGPEEFHNAGAQASYMDDNELARDIFDVGRKKCPWFVDLHADYAETVSKMGFHDEAVAALDPLRGDPAAQRSERFWTFFGSILNRRGLFERAEEVLNEGHRHLPNSGEILRELARAKTGLNDLPGAEETYRKAIEVQPSEHLARTKYADHLWERGRFEECKEQRLAAILYCEPTQANYPIYHYELAQVCMVSQEYEEAKAALDMALLLRPAFPRAMILRRKLAILRPDLFAGEAGAQGERRGEGPVHPAPGGAGKPEV